jgi:LuxR family transcriptional regulator, regulator of acetate metabolism
MTAEPLAQTGVLLPLGRGPRELIAAQRRLNSAATMPELLRNACEHAGNWCGFERALVLAIEDDHVTATLIGALSDPASDALRRRVLAEPLALRPGTAEAELIRHAEGGRPGAGNAPSLLGAALSLEQFALGAVMPEDRVLALLVLDRHDPPVDDDDRGAVQLFCTILALSIERLFLRLRMKELSTELRHLTASALAAMQEALGSPVALPRDYGAGPVFPAILPAPQSSDRLRELFTPREAQIAGQMVAGRSNREIAAELHLSPETVKGYVGRVLRKLGASNRVDAVSRYFRLTDANDR